MGPKGFFGAVVKREIPAPFQKLSTQSANRFTNDGIFESAAFLFILLIVLVNSIFEMYQVTQASEDHRNTNNIGQFGPF